MIFADDTCLNGGVAGQQHKIQDDLNAINIWLDRNSMSANTKKCEVIFFGRRAHDNLLGISGENLKETQTVKYLGVQIDAQLTFKSHIETVTKKLARLCGLLTKIRFLPRKDLIQFYQSYLVPVFSYGLLCYGGTSQNALRSIYILQKRALRIIFKRRYLESIQEYFSDNNIMTVYELYVYELCKQITKMKSADANNDLTLDIDYATSVTHRPRRRPIRHSFRTQYYKHSTFIRINRLWAVLAEAKVVPNITVWTEAESKKFLRSMKSSFLPGNLELVNYIFH